jgi:hypothetical protein
VGNGGQKMTQARNAQISGIILLTIIVCLFSSSAFAKYGGGIGEPNDPYLIYTAEQLNTIGLNQEDADKHFKLMADIDLSAYQGDTFNRIGFYDPPEFAHDWHQPFSGVFDGNGHTISNFTYVVDVNQPLKEKGLWGDECVGLFGVVCGSQAQIKNLVITPDMIPKTRFFIRYHCSCVRACSYLSGFVPPKVKQRTSFSCPWR